MAQASDDMDIVAVLREINERVTVIEELIAIKDEIGKANLDGELTCIERKAESCKKDFKQLSGQINANGESLEEVLQDSEFLKNQTVHAEEKTFRLEETIRDLSQRLKHLEINQSQGYGKLLWKLKRQDLNQKELISPVFRCEKYGYKFRLTLKPRGTGNASFATLTVRVLEFDPEFDEGVFLDRSCPHGVTVTVVNRMTIHRPESQQLETFDNPFDPTGLNNHPIKVEVNHRLRVGESADFPTFCPITAFQDDQRYVVDDVLLIEAIINKNAAQHDDYAGAERVFEE